MYQQGLGNAAFYRLLLLFDEELAAAERPKGCRVCGKRLEASDFPRKPRGFGLDLGERFTERLSFCCADRTCRKRRTPPSAGSSPSYAARESHRDWLYHCRKVDMPLACSPNPHTPH